MENNTKKPKIMLMKSIAVILINIMVLQFFPAIVFGMQQTDLLESDEMNETEEMIVEDENVIPQDTTEIIGEIEEKRTLNEKHFLQNDGTILAAVYPSDIHYEVDGKLVDINNSLEETNEDEGTLQNRNNQFKVKFAKKSNKNNLVKIQVKNHNVKWSLENSNKVSAVKINENNEKGEKLKLKNISSGTIQYENILNNIDLQYNVISNTIKENIILKNKSAINQNITFEFKTDKLKMEKTEDGRIIFYEKNKEDIVFYLDALYMYDNKNEISNNIDVKIEGKNNKYTLTIIPNKEWLEEENREYPVTIDPTVQTSLNYENIQDTYIFNGDEGYPNRHNAHILRVGSNNTIASKNPMRSLIKFNLPNISAGDQVISAMLDICSYPDTNEWNPPTQEIQIDVHKMTQNWTASSAKWNDLNTKYDKRICDYTKYKYNSNDPTKFYYFDITAIVKKWYVTGNNYGLVLKDHTEVKNAPHSDAYFFSADINKEYINARPMVQITYRNQSGLEDYQTYHSKSMGRAGTVYSNDYNGNLVLVHHDMETPSTELSSKVFHVYNTNTRTEDVGYGKGFQLNISQKIIEENLSGVQYAKYIDEDGTKHYFKKSGNKYTDEDNLGLTLTFKNNNYYLQDKNKTKLTFVKKEWKYGNLWHLKEIQDAFGNKTQMDLIDDVYVGARVSKVTDPTGDFITINYNTGNRIDNMVDKAGRTMKYTYDTNGNLVSITYADGKQCKYAYDKNFLLTQVKNIDNAYLNFQYYNEKSNRLKNIKEYSLAGELGNTLDMEYGDNITKFKDNKGYSNTYTFNNYGQTISISDFGNSPNNIDNAYGKMYQYGSKQSDKNKLLMDGNLISVTQKKNNLIKNGTFKDGMANWNTTNCNSNDKIENGSFKFIGESNVDKNIYQTINVSGKKGDIFTLATWFNSKAVPNNAKRKIKIALTIHFIKADGTRQEIDKNLNVDGSGWQFKSEVVIANTDYVNAIVYLVCSYNENETYFDNVGLFKEEFGQSYTFDSKGNVISTKDKVKQANSFRYDNDSNLIKSINPSGGKITYDYDVKNPKKLNYAVNAVGNKYSFSYNKFGNITKAKIEESSGIDAKIKYEPHISNVGWANAKEEPEIAGTSELKETIEAIKINLTTGVKDAKVTYQAHVQNIGWQDWVSNGAVAGTEGQSLNIEALKIKVENLPNYSIKYRVYVQGVGWQNWVTNEAVAGTTGQNKGICAIQIKLEYINSSNKYIENTAKYTANGGYQTETTDEMGNTTKYVYDDKTGNLTLTRDANNKETKYSYDKLGNVTQVSKTVGTKNYTNTYSIENDRIKTIKHNNFSYSFVYDNFGNVTQTKVGSKVLITNHYEANNGDLLSREYGNKQKISYSYDRFHRLIKTTTEAGNFEYGYDGNSNLKTIKDTVNNNTQTFQYDLSDRLVSTNNTNGFTSAYQYDINNNINNKKYNLSNRSNNVQYNYDKAERLKTIKLNNTITFTNNMDKLSRITSKVINSGNNTYKVQYKYKDVSNVANKTTTLLQSVKNGSNSEIIYTYDKLGNITTIKKGNTQTNQYYYDELSQLIRENDATSKKTIVYEYDLGGNITSKKEYGYTTGEIQGNPVKEIKYKYENTTWKDQLTNYNGKKITYDAIGNPLTYDGNTYTWQNGRQLASIKNASKEVKFKYNADGIRTQKIVSEVVPGYSIEGTPTNYYLEGTKVIYETTGNNVIYYTYDENDSVIGLKYNDIQYYYIKNAQNDIIGILDANLVQVVSYEYDSWGKILHVKDKNGKEITDGKHIGMINPYRYRSYRYDEETGLYYLNSRYYNPEWGRFINFDNYGGQVGELLSHNGYAYCKNNPVNMVDEEGDIGLLSLCAGALAVIALAITVSTIPQQTWTDIGESITTTVTGIAESISSGIASITTNKKTKTQTVTQTTTKNKNKEKSNYWEADILNKNIIIGKPLNFSEANNRISQGKSIMCSDNMAAWGIAKNYPARILEPPHKGEGYYWHYHINKNEHNNVHIWFYGQPYVKFK